MPLKSRNQFPPGGFPFREPALNWASPNDGAPFSLRAAQISAVRMANPHAGLNPDPKVCAEDLDLYTCTRLNNDPRWCWSSESPVAKAAARARQPAPCKGCGKRRRGG